MYIVEPEDYGNPLYESYSSINTGTFYYHDFFLALEDAIGYTFFK